MSDENNMLGDISADDIAKGQNDWSQDIEVNVFSPEYTFPDDIAAVEQIISYFLSEGYIIYLDNMDEQKFKVSQAVKLTPVKL